MNLHAELMDVILRSLTVESYLWDLQEQAPQETDQILLNSRKILPFDEPEQCFTFEFVNGVAALETGYRGNNPAEISAVPEYC